MSGTWRSAVLFFNSLMVLGTIFAVDMPTALQHEVINSRHTPSSSNTTDETDCKVCLGLGAVRYNLLHSSLRWTSAILSLPVGYLIDRLGNGRSAILLTLLQFLGSLLFAVSAISQTPISTTMYILMVTARILLAFGETPLCFVQSRVVAHWFSDRALLPLSFIILSQRVGAMLAFYVTATIANEVGFGVAVWSGTGLCGLGVLSACCLAIVLRKGQIDKATKDIDTSQTGCGFIMIVFAAGRLSHMSIEDAQKSESEKEETEKINIDLDDPEFIKAATNIQTGFKGCKTRKEVKRDQTFADIKAIPKKFWIHVCMVALLYGQIISFHANLPEYLVLQYGFSGTVSSYITGATMLPFIVGPLVALALNKIDCIGVLMTGAAAVMIPVFSLFRFSPSVNPLILAITLGTANIITELGLWQVAVLLLPRSCFGTVTGIMYLVRNTVVGLSLLLDGYLLQKQDEHGISRPLRGYNDFFLALVIMTSLSVLCGILLNVVDIRDTCAINQRIGRWKHSTEENIKLLHTGQNTNTSDRNSAVGDSTDTGGIKSEQAAGYTE